MGKTQWGGVALAAAMVVWAMPGHAGVVSATPQREVHIEERISLDLKGVDILDVLKLLSQKSALNFVAGRNVSGRVTIFVADVNVWEAFERIIGANDLAYESRGDIVTVMSARDYELIYGEKFQARTQRVVMPLQYAKAVQVATTLNQLKSAVGQVIVDEASNTMIVIDVPSRIQEMQEVLKQLDRETQTRVYALDYVNLEELQGTIQDLLSPIGTLMLDTRTKTMVLTDLIEILDSVDQLVRAFNTPEGQVLIEAKIVKVDLTDQMDMGIDWQLVFSGIDGTYRANFDLVTGDVLGGTATGTAFRVVSSHDDASLVIEALKSLTTTETLASPRIMVANHQEARILVGTKEAFVTTTTTVPATGSTVSAPQIEFVDVGTKLFVTPEIMRDGYVRLLIRPEVSSAETVIFQDNRIPIVTSTEAETTVLVKSGVTIIIGGLIEETITKTNSRVPWLGDLPFIGVPFRGTSEKTQKTELVVFVTPKIIMPDGSLYVPLPAAEAMTSESAIPKVVLKDPVSAVYRTIIRQRLQEHLGEQFRLMGLSGGSVAMSFILSHDGRLIDEPMITSAQGFPFIQAAKAAFVHTQPFPAFPEGSGATEVRFHLAVDYVPHELVAASEREHQTLDALLAEVYDSHEPPTVASEEQADDVPNEDAGRSAE